jgi:hypothetical protein
LIADHAADHAASDSAADVIRDRSAGCGANTCAHDGISLARRHAAARREACSKQCAKEKFRRSIHRQSPWVDCPEIALTQRVRLGRDLSDQYAIAYDKRKSQVA